MEKNLSNRKERLFVELHHLMERQTELYGSLKTALSDEKNRIVNADLKGLAETGQRKETLLLRIQGLEKDRIELMKELSGILKISFQDLTVGKLMAYSRGYYTNRIKRSRDTLLKLAGQIKQMNRLNKLLVRHTLELITGSYAFLSQLAAPQPVYQSTGGLRLGHQSGKYISDSI